MTYKLLKIYELLEEIDGFTENLKNNEVDPKEIVNIYKSVKNSLPYFYHNGELTKYYGRVIASLMSCEGALPKEFIIESNPVFNYFEDDTIIMPEEDTRLLDKIVLQTRKELLSFFSMSDPNEKIKRLCFTNDCYEASSIVRDICDDNGIKNYVIEIHPGFSSKANLSNGNGFHYFNIINIGNKYYLVDCTYRQFFKLKGNNLEKIGILNMPGCHPGTFMLMDEERKKVSQKILKDGWIELDEQVLKTYLDGFAISYRNGIYYAKTNDYSYKTDYTPDDYIRFLKGEDNQINHEGKECLGYQRRLTKDI